MCGAWGFVVLFVLCVMLVTSSMDSYWTVYGSTLSFDTPNEEA